LGETTVRISWACIVSMYKSVESSTALACELIPNMDENPDQ